MSMTPQGLNLDVPEIPNASEDSRMSFTNFEWSGGERGTRIDYKKIGANGTENDAVMLRMMCGYRMHIFDFWVVDEDMDIEDDVGRIVCTLKCKGKESRGIEKYKYEAAFMTDSQKTNMQTKLFLTILLNCGFI